jgi:hypothetical protein
VIPCSLVDEHVISIFMVEVSTVMMRPYCKEDVSQGQGKEKGDREVRESMFPLTVGFHLKFTRCHDHNKDISLRESLRIHKTVIIICALPLLPSMFTFYLLVYSVYEYVWRYRHSEKTDPEILTSFYVFIFPT